MTAMSPVLSPAAAVSTGPIAPVASDRGFLPEALPPRSRTWPYHDEDEIAAVATVLRSGKVNNWTGPDVARFEKAYALHLGRRHAIAVANGTLALELALHALDLPRDAEVIVPPRSFVASASAIRLAGARPVFADVDPASGNISAETIEPQLSERTGAILVVHLAGWPCDMGPIMALAGRHGLRVIEDCAQAHGATIDGRPVGAFGDVACFSFCQDKIISTGGEGGLVSMDDDALWRRAWSRKEHGKNPELVASKDHKPGFRWLHDTLGTNMRMSGIQAAMGLHQLGLLERRWRKRDRNASILKGHLDGAAAVEVPQVPATMRHAWYRFYVNVRPERLVPGWSRERIIAETTALGLPCFSGSCSEIYREKAFDDLGAGPLAEARRLGETSLAYLVDPSFDEATMRLAAQLARTVLDRAGGDDAG